MICEPYTAWEPFLLYKGHAVRNIDCYTHADFLQEPHESRGRHNADLPHKRLGYCHASFLFAAAFWIRLPEKAVGVIGEVNFLLPAKPCKTLVISPPEGQSRRALAGAPSGGISPAASASAWSWGLFVGGGSALLPPPSFQWAPSPPVKEIGAHQMLRNSKWGWYLSNTKPTCS